MVRRHVIRDVHKYCDAYVLHSQGSFTLQQYSRYRTLIRSQVIPFYNIICAIRLLLVSNIRQDIFEHILERSLMHTSI